MRACSRRTAKWGCLSLGSVMLFAAVTGYWWYLGCGGWGTLGGSQNTLVVEICTQGVGLARLSSPIIPPSAPSRWRFRRAEHSPGLWPWVRVGRLGGPGVDVMVQVPMSNLALLTLSAGMIFWRLDRRRVTHECPKCGYDRRGLAEGAVCPECGSTSPPQTPLRASASPR